MLTMDALAAYGADTQTGLAQCLNDGRLYLGLVEMLMYDSRFDDLFAAVKSMDANRALHTAHALAETASSLALRPLAEQIEKMLLCLRVQGDSAVLEKQMRLVMRGLEQLRMIDM